MHKSILSRIQRDPATEGGGGAPAPEQSNIVTPTSYGGSTAHQDWEDPYKDPVFQAQLKPQPPSNGNQTAGATAPAEGGNSVGQAVPAGIQLDPNQSTTATTGNGQPVVEAKGAISAEDRKYWETKDPAYKDMPDHPAVAKMSSGFRELESKFTQSQQYLGQVNQTMQDYQAVLQSGDPAEIAKMVEHFGGEVKFDTRTPETVVAEKEASYRSVYDALVAVSHELPQDAIPVLNRVLTQLYGDVEAAKGEHASNQKVRAQVEAMAKAAGITPKIGNPHERYQDLAKANMTTLEREMNTPDFWDYYSEIKPAFMPGGMFHAQGITAGKAFGSSEASARYYMGIAKSLWMAKNMETKIIPKYEQSWLAKQQGNGAVGAPPKGAGAVMASNQIDPKEAAYERRIEEYAKRQNGIGV